jgi:hypothetical protein
MSSTVHLNANSINNKPTATDGGTVSASYRVQHKQLGIIDAWLHTGTCEKERNIHIFKATKQPIRNTETFHCTLASILA